jgi:plastocyanin
VADNFFSPKQTTVPLNTVIVWKWSRLNGETHDVYLLRKPKGVKRFQSAPAATDYTFKRKLRKAGRYRIICTFHENMAMRIDVRR